MMPVQEAEVVIVGAGVSGLGLALYLGRRGHAVCVVDKAPAPRDKVCGEGIMPLGIRCLAALGLDASALPGADFDGLDYLAPVAATAGPGPFAAAACAAPGALAAAFGPFGQGASPARALRRSLRFPPGVRGRGVRRTRLIAALEAAVRACPAVRCTVDEVRGVEWRSGRVEALRGQRATYRGTVLVAADGVNSRLARWCGAEPWRYGERLALRRHYRLPAESMPARVQVGLLGGADVYLTPVGPTELLATTLTSRPGRRAMRGDYEAFLRSGPYAALFAEAEPVSECLAGYHPLFHARRFVPGGVFMVGDAGGGIDPCLGMGMSLALHTSLAAGEAIASLLRAPAAAANGHKRRPAERAFVRERRRLFLHYHHFGRVFRALAGSPRGGRALLLCMGVLPRLAERVLAIVADLRPWRAMGMPGAAGHEIPSQLG